ncbi:MAG TPA: YdcF family protein [Anaeromyxobacter sp.]
MFVWLSKVLDWLAAPLTWALLLLLGAALLRARPRRSLALGALAVAVLVVFSVEPVTNRLDRLVERGAVSTYRPEVVYDAVVVLGGMVDSAATRTSGELELDAHVERLLRTWELLRAGKARMVVLSAGALDPQPGDVPEADRLAAKLVAWGIPPSQVVVEASSRNTRENAIESSRIAAARGWHTILLVTSAAHMPRALGCFRAVGLEPDALPVDHRAGDGQGQAWLPRAGGLARSTDALRELLGRFVYRVAGYSR